MVGLGRNAVIYVNNVLVGYGKGFSTHATQEVDKDYSVDAAAPALLAGGNQTYTFTIKKLAVDGSILTLLLDGETFTVIAYQGASPLAPYETLTGCIITDYNKDHPEKGGVVQDVSGEGILIAPTDS